jgi:hypothetical protein
MGHHEIINKKCELSSGEHSDSLSGLGALVALLAEWRRLTAQLALFFLLKQGPYFFVEKHYIRPIFQLALLVENRDLLLFC